MRITCPLCGARDRREYSHLGTASLLNRPAMDDAPEEWDDYLHNRALPEGVAHDLWYHEPCGAWLHVTRNRRTSQITAVALVNGGDPA